MPALALRLLLPVVLATSACAGAAAGPLHTSRPAASPAFVALAAMSACQRCKLGCNAKSGAIERQNCLAGCASSCRAEDMADTIRESGSAQKAAGKKK